jgi:hypothetical protein
MPPTPHLPNYFLPLPWSSPHHQKINQNQRQKKSTVHYRTFPLPLANYLGGGPMFTLNDDKKIIIWAHANVAWIFLIIFFALHPHLSHSSFDRNI